MAGNEKDLKRKQLGKSGEDIACCLLQEKGFEVLCRNFRGGRKEIDIVCRDGNDLRFVEVKSRQEPVEGEPWEAVDARKQKNIGEAARRFISSPKYRPFYNNPDAEIHFDVVTVIWNQSGTAHTDTYIPDAFILTYV